MKRLTDLVAGDIMVLCKQESQYMGKVVGVSQNKHTIGVNYLPVAGRGFSKGVPHCLISFDDSLVNVAKTKKEAKAIIENWRKQNI